MSKSRLDREFDALEEGHARCYFDPTAPAIVLKSAAHAIRCSCRHTTPPQAPKLPAECAHCSGKPFVEYGPNAPERGLCPAHARKLNADYFTLKSSVERIKKEVASIATPEQGVIS